MSFNLYRRWLRVASIVLLVSCFAGAQSDGSHPGSIQFTNVTAAAGIKFTNYRGNEGIAINREIFGPGVCVADFDGDGLQDIYFVNGRDLYHHGVSVRNALYHNNGDGTFTDVTDKAGVPGTGYGMGCIWGDYNNSGFPSLYVTQYGRNVLYRNNGDGTFTDVTDKAKVAGTESGTLFHSGAVFFDYDRDGLLDLYVAGYVNLEAGPRYCPLRTVQSSCAPSAYKGSANILYHNNGDGTFTNVTVASGIYKADGKGLAVGVGDYDNDGLGPTTESRPTSFITIITASSPKLASPRAWRPRRAATSWQPCASPWATTTTTDGSTSTSPISRRPPTISGTMTTRAISGMSVPR